MTKKNIQTEIDASFLYQQLAKHEEDELIASVYQKMSGIEKSHAVAFAKKENINLENIFIPSWRARILNTLGKICLPEKMSGILASDRLFLV